MNHHVPFYKRLQTAFDETGLSREALARRLGVSASTVRRWVSGAYAPDVCDLPEIADFFGVSYRWFLEDDSTEVPNASGTAETPSASGTNCDEGISVMKASEILGLSPETALALARLAKTEDAETLGLLDLAVGATVSAVDAAVCAACDKILRASGDSLWEAVRKHAFSLLEDRV